MNHYHRFFPPGVLGWPRLLRRVGREFLGDNLTAKAAELSYYFLLAIFPFLFILTTILGYMAGPGSVVLTALEHYFRRVVPPGSYGLVIETLHQIRSSAGAGKLSFGIIGTLWAASMGMSSIIDGLNRAYQVKEERPWWKVQCVAVLLTFVLGTFLVIALLLVLYGERLFGFMANRMGVQRMYALAWSIGQWFLVVVMVWIALAFIYRFAPDLHRNRWVHVTPGAAVSTGLWIVASLGLRFYLRYFNTYQATYGSLGAVIILLLWFYLSGIAILVGGEVNSVIENAEAAAGSRDARFAGEKTPGERARTFSP
ncbi:MAG TPA: YihY/virulence factor BrkB family protein [Bryobacteraceae bacterium]|nr:YihY/virulence factor BrkB family protein [Bryobacteraceae bacterium]